MASLDQTQFTFIKRRSFSKKRKQESKPRNYTYITPQAKNLFLELFLFHCYKIHDAANKAGIKYSSAKTILFTHRQQYKQELIRDKLAANSIEANCCGYKLKLSDQSDNVKIITRVGI